MSRYVIIAIVAIFALQNCVAKPKGKAPEVTPLEQIQANAKILVDNVTHVLGLEEIPDSKKVVEILNTNTQKLATQVETIVAKLKTELDAHKNDINPVLKSVEQKLTETANSLQQAVGPEATAKAKELKGQLEKGLKTTLAEVDKLAKAVEPDATKAKADIQSAVQILLDQVVDISKKVQTGITDSIAEHEKTHKH